MYSRFLILAPVALGLHKFNRETGELDVHLKSLAAPLRPFNEPVPATAVESQETTAAGVAKVSTTGFEWSVSEWSRCDVECGQGIQRRKVDCRNIVTKVLGDESICKIDFPTPDSTRDCQGDCLSCPVSHGELFRRTGLGKPAEPANFEVNTRDEYSLCQVQPGAVASCCTAANEDMIRSEVARLTKSLDDMMLAVPTLTARVDKVLQNFTDALNVRKEETEAVLAEVNAAMQNNSADPTRTLPVLKEVLLSRITYFQNSIATVAKAAGYITAQITSFDGGKDVNGNTCGRAAMTLFTQISCAACTVDFPDKFVVNSAVQVSEFDCGIFHKACRSTIAQGHGSLLNALRELSRVHAELRKQAMRVQPALTRVWNNLRFDWMPGTLPRDINKNPDLTQLQCVRQSVMFDLPQISRSNDFCALYASPLEAGTFAGRVRQTLLQGRTTMDDLLTCDACVHAVLTRLPALIVQGADSASLEVRFPTEASKVCLMANRVPKSVSLINAMRAQLPNLPKTEQLSPSSFEELTSEPDSQGSEAPAPAAPAAPVKKQNAPWPVRFSKTGADVGVIGNITSWDALVSVGKLIPPRPIWEPESSGVRLQVWDKACVAHEDCYDQGGTSHASWWFCASPLACKKEGTCTASDAELLNKSAKCAKGHCIDGSQAVDGVCPEVAVCPAEAPGTFFGPAYFSKLQLVHEEVTNPGVCDCAFAPSADGNEFTVEDKCKQAACIAYAQLWEENSACKLKLFDTCEKLRTDGCDVVCTPDAIAWTPPVCQYTFDGSSALNSEASSAAAIPWVISAVAALVYSLLVL